MLRGATLLVVAVVLLAGCARPPAPEPDLHKDCFHIYEPGKIGQALVKVLYLPSGESPDAPPLDQTQVTIEQETEGNWSRSARADEWGCAVFLLPGPGSFHAFARHQENEACQWYDGSRFDYGGNNSVRINYALDYHCFDAEGRNGNGSARI